MECSYSFLKRVFLVFLERNIQNPVIFRTLSNIYNGTFYKNSYLVHFQLKLKKIKKIHHEKKFLLFQEMKLSGSNIKKILIFSQKKAFLIFPKIEPCTFQPKLEILENSVLRKFLIFRKISTF